MKKPTVIAFFAAVLLGFVQAETYPKVKLELYYEALCPGTVKYSGLFSLIQLFYLFRLSRVHHWSIN
jgi:hypothetical protein